MEDEHRAVPILRKKGEAYDGPPKKTQIAAVVQSCKRPILGCLCRNLANTRHLL